MRSLPVVERLQEVCAADGVTIPDAGLKLIARAGEGSMRDAQSLLDQVISFGGNTVTLEQVTDILGLVDRQLLYGMLEGILKGDADRCLAAIDQVYTFGYELSQFTNELLEVLRNATLVGLSPSSRKYLDVSDEERALLEGLVHGVPSETFVRAFQVMLEVARLVAIRPAKPIEHVVDRVVDLERRLRQAGVSSRPKGPGGSGSGGSGSGGAGSSGAGPGGGGPSGPSGPPRGAPPSRASAPEVAPQPPITRPTPVAAPPEAAPAPSPPPKAPPQPASERFLAFQSWLDEQGVTYQEWARYTALDREAPPVLRVLFSDDRVRRLAAPPTDPVIVAGLARFFPACSQVQVDVRGAGSTIKTRQEVIEEQRRRELERKRAALDRHPVVLRVREVLGADLVGLENGAGG